MKTPRNATSALFRVGLMDFDPNPICSAGLLGRAGTWSRGPACGDATVQAHMRTAHDHRAPCPAPRSHLAAKADGTCLAALRRVHREGDRPDVAGPSSISRVASLRLAHSTFGRSTVCGYIRISVTPRAVLNRFPIFGDAPPDARELSFGACRAMLPDL
jgi:hypothetical protein